MVKTRALSVDSAPVFLLCFSGLFRQPESDGQREIDVYRLDAGFTRFPARHCTDDAYYFGIVGGRQRLNDLRLPDFARFGNNHADDNPAFRSGGYLFFRVTQVDPEIFGKAFRSSAERG